MFSKNFFFIFKRYNIYVTLCFKGLIKFQFLIYASLKMYEKFCCSGRYKERFQADINYVYRMSSQTTYILHIARMPRTNMRALHSGICLVLFLLLIFYMIDRKVKFSLRTRFDLRRTDINLLWNIVRLYCTTANKGLRMTEYRIVPLSDIFWVCFFSCS